MAFACSASNLGDAKVTDISIRPMIKGRNREDVSSCKRGRLTSSA